MKKNNLWGAASTDFWLLGRPLHVARRSRRLWMGWMHGHLVG